MRFIDRLTIQKQLRVLICVPLLFLAVVIVKESTEIRATLTRTENVEELANLAGLLAGAIHSLQEERTMTDGFLAGREVKSANRLREQRIVADHSLAGLKDFLAASTVVEADPQLSGMIQKVLAGFAGLVPVRRQVDARAVNGNEVFPFFTKGIHELLAALQLNAQNCPDAEVGKLLAGHYNFAEALERMNIERVLLANTFAHDEFATFMFMRFAENLAEQKIYLQSFMTLADAGARGFYQGKMRGSAISGVDDFRKIAIDKRFGGGFNVDPEQWLVAITGKIKLMKEVEERLKSDFSFLAAARREETALLLTAKVIGGISIFILTVVASMLISASLVRSLSRITTDLNDSAFQVSAAASQLAATSQTVADQSSRQAASLEETAASMEEMSAMIKRDAENTAQADALMKVAGKVLIEADGSMKKLNVSMEEINAASLQTQKIVKTIDEIAFQTNLLALNAAVEAARAGEAGAGFAVVADEVRNLAQRAAEAAKNTSGLIEGTMQKVQAGAGLVTETSGSFDSAQEAVAKIAILLTESAAASREEAEAVHQVNEAMRQVDSATQENSASAEEMASAAEELSSQTVAIKSEVLELLAMIGEGRRRQASKKSARGGQVGVRKAAAGASASRRATPQRLSITGGLKATAIPAGSRRKKIGDKTGGKQDPAAVIPFDEDDFKNF